jgi:GrpB-like predicted nucleotidyltransferase (UPF0157 family)
MLGLVKGEFRLVDYDAKWKELFVEERCRLEKMLGSNILRIEHVGSTSLTIMAKPVIDMAIGMDDLEKVKNCVKILESFPEYVYKGENGIEGRHLFAKYNGAKGTHHIHFQLIGSANWENQILFRDFLLDNPREMQQYEALKKNLVVTAKTRLEYTESKDEFIKKIIVKAKEAGYSAKI